MGPDGSIWGMPYNASTLLKIQPSTGEVREIGSFPLGGWKWHGGTKSGDYIIGIPSHAESVLLIEPSTEKYWLLGSGYVGKYKWGGAQTDADGMVWAIPSDVDYALRIDPFKRTVERVGPHPDLPDVWRNKWQGGVYSKTTGMIYCIPCDAPKVLVIDSKTCELSLLGSGTGEMQALKKFQGAATDANGIIWALPEAADRILKITPHIAPPKGVNVQSAAAGMEVPVVTNVCHGQTDTMPARLKPKEGGAARAADMSAAGAR